jgi:DNA-binding beta-propeller fold protein YncE
MAKFHALFLTSLSIVLLPATDAWAKKRAPTPTPTVALAPTPTEEPTPIPFTGKKLYTFDAMWGSQGTGTDQLNAPEALDIGPDGKIFIADTGNNRILVWDSNGKPLQAFGSLGNLAAWRNPPQFNHPAGIMAPASKKVYVADTLNHRVVVLDEKGLVVTSWGNLGTENGQFNQPRSIARDRQGNVWVLDSENSRYQVFSALGDFNSVKGTFGTDPGLLNHPLGMTLNKIDQVIIADTGNYRLQVFNNDGAPVTTQGWFGSGPYQFKRPTGVVVTKTGLVAVVDGPTGRVEFFNNRFEFVSQWRAKDEILDKNFHPHLRGIACDDQNRLYVTDAQSNAVIRLRLLEIPNEGTPTPVPPKPTPTRQEDPYGGAGYPIR